MSCKVKQQALNKFEKEGATKNGIIEDFNIFDRINAELTRTATEKYGVGTGDNNLFSVSMDTAELTVVPNDTLLNALDEAVEKYKQAHPRPAVIRDRLSDIEEITDEKMQELYDNYAALMGRKEGREDKALPFENFKGLIHSTNVYKYKDTYIFGNYDVANNVFLVTLSSSPSSKQLLAEALPNIVDNFDVIGSAPKDVIEKYTRSGYVASTASYEYDFKGEKMDKYLYASNPGVIDRIFGKSIDQLTSEEVENITHRIMPLPEYQALLSHLAYKKDNMDISFVSEKLKNLKVPAHRRRYFIKTFRKNLTEAKKYAMTKQLSKYGHSQSDINTIMEAINKNAKTKGELMAVQSALNSIGVKLDKQHLIMKEYGAINKRYSKANMSYEIKKLYDYRKVQIDEKDVNALGAKAQETDTKLNKLLVNYLSHFGIKVEYLEDIQSQLGIDSLGTVDMLNKIAYVDKKNTTELPEMAGRFIAYMLQHNPNMATLLDSMKKVGRYKNSSKAELIEVAGELIAEQLHKKSKTEIPPSLAQKIKTIIAYFFDLINEIKMNKINREIGFIADNVLAGNQALIVASKYKPGDEGSKVTKVNLHDAIAGDEFADVVVNEMAEVGFTLTGSTVLAEQGSVLRPEGNQMHDIDWVSTFGMEKTMEKVNKLYPNRFDVRLFADDKNGVDTYTFLISPKGTKVSNVSQVEKGNVVVYYDVVDEKTGKIVGTYNNRNGVETHTGVQAKPIDIFINRPGTSTEQTPTTLASGTKLNMSNWRNVFAAKLSYGRLKDIWDYNRFIPNEYIQDNVFESKLEQFRDDNKSPFLSYVPVGDRDIENDVAPVDMLPVNEHIMFNNGDGPFTAAEVLANIKANFPNLNDNTQFLLEKVIPLLSNTNAKIRFVSENELKAGDTFMQYSADNNEILISKDRLAVASPEFAVQGFLHEVAHSVTVEAYLRPVTMEQQMFRDFIDEQYNKYKNASFVEEYGLTNAVEFMAEAISNREFQTHMIALDKAGDTFWTKLVDYIRMLFGVPRKAGFHAVVDSIVTIIDNADSNFEGLGGTNNIFEFKQEQPNVPSLKTIQERAARILDIATSNLEQAAKRVKVKGKSASSKKAAKDFRTHLNDLREEMEHVAKTEQFQAIVMYAESLRKTVYDLKGRLEKADKDAADFIETANHFQKYLDSYDMIEDINRLLSEARADKTLTDSQRKDVEEVRSVLATFAQDHIDLVNDLATYKRDSWMPRVATLENFQEVEYEWTEKLRAEYDKATANGLSVDEWITQQMTGPRADEIQADVEAAARSLALDIDEDITWAEAKLSDPLNANSSKLFQLAVNIVQQTRNRINEAVLDFEFVLDKAFTKLKEGSKSTIPSKRYKGMVDQDLDGNYYLIGEYSAKWKQRYEQEYEALKNELAELKQQGFDLGMPIKEITQNPDYREIIEKMRAWEKEHMVYVNGAHRPHPKYKNDLSHLTEAEKEFIALFKQVNQANIKKFGKHGSLRTRVRGIEFHKLPAISKSNHERLLELDGKGILKDNWSDLTSIKSDDIGFQEEALDGKDRPIKDVRIHYRGAIDPNEQSIDLPTLLRLEHLNGVNYHEKSQSKIVLDEIIEISGRKRYIATSERTGQWLVNLFRKKKDVATIDGKDSVTHKRLQSYVDTTIHDILNVHAGFSLAGADVNKITRAVSGYTATLGMAANIASGTVNVMNGFSQLLFETAGGNHLNLKSLMKAEAMYTRDMPNIWADMGNPVKKSVTNQINQMFDVFGGFSVAEQEFFKDTVAKRLASFRTASAMQDGGEHMLHSVLTMAVLDGLKVMNEDGRFINKKGEVTDEKNAASMLDMLKIHESGKLFLDEEVFYTPHTRNIDFYNGGQAHISMFIKKKIFDTMGVYDSNLQPEIYRYWYGKMLLLFKRFLISQLQNRWTGITTVHKKKEDLTRGDLQFNTSLKQKMEGTHVTALRLVIGNPKESFRVGFEQGVIPMLKSFKLAHLPENYNKLSAYEKANLRKATADFLTTFVLLPAIGMLLKSMAEEDDEPTLWFAAYMVRRLESELSQFRNPKEAWRITENPVAGTRIIDNGLTFLGNLFSFWGWHEVDGNGNNKLLKSTERLIPIWVQFKKEWKKSYQFLENQAN